ncbi:MAG: glycerate kinase [Thermoplasmata archaeon]|nr:MAG: glycerate kinase [Thermoplasmata archaeon]
MFFIVITNFDALWKNTGTRYQKARKDALEILERVLEKMNGYRVVKSSVSVKGDYLNINNHRVNLVSRRNIFLLGIGKAAGSMAKAMEEIIEFDDGIVITTEEVTLNRVRVLTGTHPLPSEENVRATDEALGLLERAGKKDLIIFLISGGGSSLLCKPRIPLQSMIEVTEELMLKGCTIEELNTVRKHLSLVKGGQLAQRTEAHIISLIMSDIIGNPVDCIASGPTSPDSTTFADALRILKQYRIQNRDALQVIKKGSNGEIAETPSHLNNVDNIIIADIGMACSHARHLAEMKGYHARVIGTGIQGEAREIGKALAEYAMFFPRSPSIIIAGGETTVTVKGEGRGGRNQELVLAAVTHLSHEPLVFISCGTDGIDGNSPAAGAVADGESLEKAYRAGMKPEEYLERNDSYSFFHALGDDIITGYTGTNVMDIQIMVKL